MWTRRLRRGTHGTGLWSATREEALARWREADDAAARAEQELGSLSAMVIEREREIRGLLERLQRGQPAPRPQRRLAGVGLGSRSRRSRPRPAARRRGSG